MNAAEIIAIILGIVGIAGCILPALPGPPLSWGGLLLLYLWGNGDEISTSLLVTTAVITIAVSILDYIVPIKLTKVTGGSDYASRGAMAGLVAGIVFTPIGMILGTFLGALIAERHYTGKPYSACVKAAFGTFLGTILGIGLKLIVSIVLMYYIIRFL